MKKYSPIIFDLDGTLIDSKRGVFNSFRYSLGKFGLSLEDETEAMKFIGPPLKSVFRDFYFMEERDALKAVDYYREYYGERGVFEADLYRGIKELLTGLNDDRRGMMIATTKAACYMEKIVKNFGIGEFFIKRAGSRPDGSLSGKSELISRALKGHRGGYPVMIGDRKFDIEGARDNGIDSIGVTYGYGSEAEIKDAGPLLMAGSVEDLRNILL